jgi:hypothetical protein
MGPATPPATALVVVIREKFPDFAGKVEISYMIWYLSTITRDGPAPFATIPSAPKLIAV